MERIDFKNAYYIKLGEAGIWEQSSIEKGIMRIGWTNIDLDDIHQKKWDRIEGVIRTEIQNKGSATHDFNSLKKIHDSNHDDIWITFYNSKLWWCRLQEGQILEDEISKYRLTADGWHDKSLHGKLLLVNAIPGEIAQLQAYRATSCNVNSPETLRYDTLRRLINDEHTPEYTAAINARDAAGSPNRSIDQTPALERL